MRITEKKDVHATAYDKDGKYVTSINDSGFRTLDQVLSALYRSKCNPPHIASFIVNCNNGEECTAYHVSRNDRITKDW